MKFLKTFEQRLDESVDGDFAKILQYVKSKYKSDFISTRENKIIVNNTATDKIVKDIEKKFNTSAISGILNDDVDEIDIHTKAALAKSYSDYGTEHGVRTNSRSSAEHGVRSHGGRSGAEHGVSHGDSGSGRLSNKYH